MPDNNLRLTKIDELQFLTCLKHGPWGSKSARFSDWREGDYLMFIVDKAVAGIAKVDGPPFVSKTPVWSNGLYPHRIRLKFTQVIAPDNRPPILGRIRDVLTGLWGTRYGWAILNQMAVTGDPAKLLLDEVKKRPNSLKETIGKIEVLIDQAAALRRTPTKQSKAAKIEGPKLNETSETTGSKSEETAHTRYQYALIRLGKITGCAVWVAVNDHGKKCKGRRLGEESIKALPNLGLSKEAMQKIALIDVIWVQQNAPVYAFEVETTTQVFSGLLRMSDLLALVPALNLKLLIVAPRAREAKVMAELARPTFKKIGLSDYCRFLPAEELEALVSKIEDLGGHIQPSVLDTKAVELPTELSDIATL
jgi:hypothetical protein